MSNSDLERYKQRVAAIKRTSPAKEAALLVRIRNGDRSATSELAEPLLSVAVECAEVFATKYAWLGIDERELIQEANVMLLLAIKSFANKQRRNLEPYVRSWLERGLERHVQRVQSS